MKGGTLVRQIEDNTTKALINTVEHLTDQTRRSFLEWLSIERPSKDTCYALQTDSLKSIAGRRKQRVLLGIVAGDEPLDVTTSAGDYDRATRPDAWIYGDHYGILIESKLTKEVNPEQWAKHKTASR